MTFQLLTATSDRTTELEKLVRRHVPSRFKNNEELAKRIGMTLSGFLRATGKSVLKVENALRLARETGESASYVLRISGKADIAQLIEDCFGEPRPLPPAIRDAVEALLDLPGDLQKSEAMGLRSIATFLRVRGDADTRITELKVEATQTRSKPRNAKK